MEIWKIALFLLGVVWLLQCFGTWMQMRHFRSVMSAITDKWSDGHLGAGNARSRLGKGVIAIVVVDSAAVIRKVLVMEGRSVLAKFHPLLEHEGKDLAQLKAELEQVETQKGRGSALNQAIQQLEKIKQSSEHALQPVRI
ncbi:transcriptional regulator GutM [Paracoccus versutus]|uniref:Glucitol operon activator protein n=1 Tax=Paracoccus versutus TaxID=34007 RepID=A0A3D9XSC2_PARVE|nr:transcriptional regulator GutM [Paracoccus versutus]REF73236.1 glucitol operon activator protein [Paracoccus versutus]WGR54867.1 transcriptional regulator [Paracoccus versutus]